MLKHFFAFSLLSVSVAVSAQNCYTHSIPATTPTERFVDNKDGTVTDLVTGLMWKKCPEKMAWGKTGCSEIEIPATYGTWSLALSSANNVNTSGGYAGYSDWRVPNVKELSSLIERQCISPSINLTVFPNTPASGFWTNSPYRSNPTGGSGVWFVQFAWIGSSQTWNAPLYVRLVRSGR